MACEVRPHQRPLQTGSVVVAAAHDQQGPLLVQLLCDAFDVLIKSQHLLYQRCGQVLQDSVKDTEENLNIKFLTETSGLHRC